MALILSRAWYLNIYQITTGKAAVSELVIQPPTALGRESPYHQTQDPKPGLIQGFSELAQ